MALFARRSGDEQKKQQDAKMVTEIRVRVCLEWWAVFRERSLLRYALLKVAVEMFKASMCLGPRDPWADFYCLQCAEHIARLFEDLHSDYERRRPSVRRGRYPE